MSIITYMATPVAIETGSFGSNMIEIKSIEVLSKDKAIVNELVEIDSGLLSFEGKDLEWFKKSIVVFEGEPEMGIYIRKVPSEIARSFSKFENEFVYEIHLKTVMDPNSIINEEFMKNLKRDKKLLDEKLREMELMNGFIELYSCWMDEENLPRNRKLDKTISYEEYLTCDYIELQEKQYIKIVI